MINKLYYSISSNITEAAEKKNKPLNKPFRTPDGPKKFGVYVKNDKGNVVLVRFGDPNMEIKRDDPERRKAFRARHNCDQKKDKTSPGYWSCRMWSGKKVSSIASTDYEWDGETLFNQEDILKDCPWLDGVDEINDDCNCGGDCCS